MTTVPPRRAGAGRTILPLPAVNDREMDALPEGLPPVVDAHVHIFPQPVFEAVWLWFQEHAWPVRYQLTTRRLLSFLFDHGIRHLVALQHAHRPGIADGLNRYMVEVTHADPRITGLATVYPGETGAAEILERAFGAGLGGVKLHSHVQCFDMLGEDMATIYSVCCDHGKPLIMHVGREPRSEAYPCDPYELCRAEDLEGVLRGWPDLKVCVPHLGADEYDAYRRLIETYDTLWLDTTVSLAGYIPMGDPPVLAGYRSDRVMYGTDFPNLPYAWDREIRRIAAMDLAPQRLENLLWRNAADFYAISGIGGPR